MSEASSTAVDRRIKRLPPRRQARSQAKLLRHLTERGVALGFLLAGSSSVTVNWNETSVFLGQVLLPGFVMLGVWFEGRTDFEALVEVPLPSLAVTVAVTVAMEVIWHVFEVPVPEAQPDHE